VKNSGAPREHPAPYSFKQKLILRCLPPIIVAAYKALAATCSKERPRGSAISTDLLQENACAIIALWHEVLGLAAFCFRNRGYCTLTSKSYDGELAARAVRCFGIEAVRGSSSRAGLQALHELERVLEHGGVVGLTVDGPKGPRRKAKPGVAMLSARSGVPIIPVAFTARPGWRLGTWDKLVVPKPFGRIVQACGQLIPPPESGSREAIEETRLRVEKALDALHQELE